jgi:hypothetical protein
VSGLHWLTRVLSLLVNGVMLMLVVLALTNEDPVTPQGQPVVVLVFFCVAASLLSWWRAQLGGWLLAVGALGLGVAVIASSVITGFGLEGTVVAVLIYPVPYLIIAVLAVMDANVRAALR